jgi:hypothetical protein
VPRILEINGFVFYFFSADCSERTHVHVKKGNGEGKIWLRPEIEIFYFRRFKKNEERQILKIVTEHKQDLINQWDAYCNH